MLCPQLLVPLSGLLDSLRIDVVRQQAKSSRSADVCQRLRRGDADDRHPGGEDAREFGGALEGLLGRNRSVIADNDRFRRLLVRHFGSLESGWT